jgi:hypothetical protein
MTPARLLLITIVVVLALPMRSVGTEQERFSSLPDELLDEIMNKLPAKAVGLLGTTSKGMKT